MKVVEATVFAKVAETAPGRYGDVAVLESPAFGPDGKLYFTNVMASPDQAKIARIDLATKKVEELYKDNHSELSAIHFSPHNGNAYVVDFASGAVSRFDLKTKTLETTFNGMIGDYRAKSDDIAFDRNGYMYVTDENGTLDNPSGKLFRLDQEGRNPIVLFDKFAGANGIAFAPDYSLLWVSEGYRSTINVVYLSKDGTKSTVVDVGIHANIGSGWLDSMATDSAGNIYQSVWGAGRLMVYAPSGELIGIIQAKDDFPKGSQLFVTNLAIRSGSTEAYMVVGGKNGGYIYKFEAFAPGRLLSNGG
ncbi:SMP-30/gluconolactonase/LRE family protein [Bradyrhizobium huanghuaihaiense]|uniref:SMP-30/gluconolactonase/LRE family protein n=1 Tax=Bradyrhizobium huanghuaihaiense TaxID=990078 RepID=UPI0021A98A88|nr:SMP-30/gluconolactonase/LRE family protein [Bradyrhizobium sp. CB3035]UWU75830.1 SMP-30/gluconolactonase/LRE family protein [Bradyrhizobium sp. CB3035]